MIKKNVSDTLWWHFTSNIGLNITYLVWKINVSISSGELK